LWGLAPNHALPAGDDCQAQVLTGDPVSRLAGVLACTQHRVRHVPALEGVVNSPAAALMGLLRRYVGGTALDGVCVNIERGERTALAPPPSVFVAKWLTAMLLAGLASVIVIFLAASVGKVVPELVRWASVLILAACGVAPSGGLGSLVGILVRGQAAPAVLDLIHAPTSLLDGLWMPLSVLSRPWAQLAPVGPVCHLAQVAHHVVGEGGGLGLLSYVLDVTGVMALFLVIARRASWWVR
jgi:hypothetical protein